jgi:hypothetical protein
MKAFRESARKQFDAAGLILLFAEKLLNGLMVFG